MIEGTPKPGYRPKSAATAFFPKVKLRLWIDKKDYNWVKVDIESLDTISFGGFLFRLAKGSHVTIENARVNNEIWMPKWAAIKGSVRIALVKVMRGEMIFTFSDYKKFQTDSGVLTQQPQGRAARYPIACGQHPTSKAPRAWSPSAPPRRHRPLPSRSDRRARRNT